MRGTPHPSDVFALPLLVYHFTAKPVKRFAQTIILYSFICIMLQIAKQMKTLQWSFKPYTILRRRT